MAKLIGEFLLELDKHHSKFEAYRENPEKAMEEAGLNEHQREILLSNDLRRIREEIHKEYRDAKVIVVPFMMNVAVGGVSEE